MAIKFLNDGDFPDNAKIRIGDANDLQIYHDGSDSYIDNNGGDLYIMQEANDKDIIFQSDNGSGGVTTYFQLDGSNAKTSFSRNYQALDNVKAQFGDSNDLEVWHNATNAEVQNKTGNLNIRATATDGDIKFFCDDGAGSTSQYMRIDGGAEQVLFFNDTEHQDSVKARFGNGGDLQIYHDGSDSYIYDGGVGDLNIVATDLNLKAASDELYLTATSNGAVELYYDNSKKFETTSSGVDVTGNATVSGKVITTEIESASTILLDATADITIDAGGQDIILSDDGTIFGTLSNSSGFQIRSRVNNADMLFRGVDNGTEFNALTLDMSANGNATFAGTILDRDIPCWIGSNFLDGTSSVIYVVPFNNNSEATVSAKTYYHYATMPYAGQLKRVTFKNVSGTPSTSSFTVQLFLYVNGSQQTQSSEISWSNTNGITWSPTSSNTFSAGDEITIGYQKSTSSRTMAGVAAGIVVEFTDYDI